MKRITREDAWGLAAVAGIFVATRLVVWTAAYGGALYHFRIESGLSEPLLKLPRILREMPEAQRAAVLKSRDEHLAALAPLLNWDGKCYRTIIELGYHAEPPPEAGGQRKVQRLIAFFPLHPLLCAGLAPLVGVPAAMIGSAHCWCLLACILTYFWMRASRAVCAWAIFWPPGPPASA